MSCYVANVRMLVFLCAFMPALAGAQSTLSRGPSATWPEFERARFVLNNSCQPPDPDPDHADPYIAYIFRPPPPTPLETRLRTLLNAALDDAMQSLQLATARCQDIPAKRRWLTVEPKGDRYFVLDIGVVDDGPTSRGASAHVSAFVESLERRRENVSSSEPIRLMNDAVAQRSELERAIRLAIITVLGEYRMRISRPVMQAQLDFDLSKLTPAERGFMTRDVVGFALTTFDPLAAVRVAGKSNRYNVWFRPTSDRPAAELIQKYAGFLREDIPKTMDMYVGKPLHGYPVEVTVRSWNRLHIRVTPPAHSDKR